MAVINNRIQTLALRVVSRVLQQLEYQHDAPTSDSTILS